MGRAERRREERRKEWEGDSVAIRRCIITYLDENGKEVVKEWSFSPEKKGRSVAYYRRRVHRYDEVEVGTDKEGIGDASKLGTTITTHNVSWSDYE